MIFSLTENENNIFTVLCGSFSRFQDYGLDIPELFRINHKKSIVKNVLLDYSFIYNLIKMLWEKILTFNLKIDLQSQLEGVKRWWLEIISITSKSHSYDD